MASRAASLSTASYKKGNGMGEILDKEDNVVRHVRTLPPPGADFAEEAAEEAPQEAAPGVKVLEGHKVSMKGHVFDDDSEPIGELAKALADENSRLAASLQSSQMGGKVLHPRRIDGGIGISVLAAGKLPLPP
ncbi:hypothetical protein LTR36_005152 [Oleoguttula mirabilis]|uniref:Uncharacterized protein n=1 Tax=Oleoguttula mirabilis TaxID=1507867 RepID=A0AAV9JWZ5_9PEZI|nr:hypothetical protein LTR36_005152 [Oleoguttula mirabilis]